MKSTVAVTWLLCLVAVPLFAAEPPSVAAYIEALNNLQSGPASSVSGLTIDVSPNMKIRLTSGSAAAVMAGKEQVGLFFDGNGTFEYRSADPTEAVSVKYEAKKASELEVGSSGEAVSLTGKFQQMYLRSAAIPLPPLGAASGADVAAEFTKIRDEFAKQRWDTTAHLLAKQKFDSPASPVATVVFTGANPSHYALDTIDERNEVLSALTRNRMIANRALAGMWWPVVISDQPVGRSRKAFLEPIFLLTEIDYTLTADEKENADLVMTETILPRVTGQRIFRFDLHSTVYDSNARPREYKVRSVKDAGGKDLSYHHGHGSLLIGLPQKAAVNVPFKFRVEIEGNFLYRPDASSFWQLGTEPWFPMPASLAGQYYKVHSILKVKKPWTGFAPGQTLNRAVEGEYNVVENRIDVPVQFAVLHAGKYAVDEKTYDDGLTIRVASYAMSNDRAMKQLNNLAYKMIKFYEPWLGPFPFKEFNIIEINELGYGQAPPATMFITKEAFNPTMGDDNKLFSQGINHRFAHEIAHQYWGHVVKMGSPEEQWVTESFAEYSSALAIKQLKGPSAYNAMVAGWKADAKDSTSISPIPFGNRIRIPSDMRASMMHRQNLIYDKGAFILAVLHKQLGDAKFFTFMRSLQGILQWKFLTTSEMPKLLARIEPGTDWNAFFDRYFWGVEMPAL